MKILDNTFSFIKSGAFIVSLFFLSSGYSQKYVYHDKTFTEIEFSKGERVSCYTVLDDIVSVVSYSTSNVYIGKNNENYKVHIFQRSNLKSCRQFKVDFMSGGVVNRLDSLKSYMLKTVYYNKKEIWFSTVNAIIKGKIRKKSIIIYDVIPLRNIFYSGKMLSDSILVYVSNHVVDSVIGSRVFFYNINTKQIIHQININEIDNRWEYRIKNNVAFMKNFTIISDFTRYNMYIVDNSKFQIVDTLLYSDSLFLNNTFLSLSYSASRNRLKEVFEQMNFIYGIYALSDSQLMVFKYYGSTKNQNVSIDVWELVDGIFYLKFKDIPCPKYDEDGIISKSNIPLPYRSSGISFWSDKDNMFSTFILDFKYNEKFGSVFSTSLEDERANKLFLSVYHFTLCAE